MDQTPQTCGESGLKNLVANILLNEDRTKVPLTGLAAHFDAGGHEDDQAYVVVAGFVAPASMWIEFDGLWRERLERDGLEYFHAVDFAHSKEQFAGWRDDEPRRRALVQDLMSILKRNVSRKFGCAVINESLRSEMSDEVKEASFVNAYSLAGRTCVVRLWQWMRENRYQSVPMLIFEDGDKGKDVLRKGMEQDEFPEPIFMPKTTRIRRDGTTQIGLTPLQAADWLAYESFLSVKSRKISRWPMVEFQSTPGHIEVLQAEHIADMQNLLSDSMATVERLRELKAQYIR